MLVLSRQKDESIMIGDDIEIVIVDVRGDKVRLGITAPTRIPVHRMEIYQAIQREKAEAKAAEEKAGQEKVAEAKAPEEKEEKAAEERPEERAETQVEKETAETAEAAVKKRGK